jgi:ACT domain-containing protein
MKDSKIIVTISGGDRVGIVAAIANVLAENKVNIEDIRQTIMQGQFVMFLMGDISKSDKSFLEIKNGLLEKAKELKMEIWVQKKAIFDKMHTI